MTFVSYAQNFEDVMLWRAFPDVGQGQYLDIGAQDPVVDSVSLAFYNAGWRGVHVEPTAAYAARLRAARPDEVVIEAAVSDAAGPIEFYEIDDTGISTGRSDIADHHARSGFQPRKIFAPTVRLDALLAMIDGDLHWTKVDVEGMEAAVLRSWGDSPRRPWILVIESTFPSSQVPTHDQWIEEVFRREYREVFHDGLSRYFLHSSQSHREVAFSAPANVFDGFAVARHHFSARCVRDELEAAEARYSSELASAAQQRELAEASAASALEQEAQVRNELAAAIAKEAALLTRMAESERDHAERIDVLWREREAVETDLRSEFKAVSDELRQTLALARDGEAAARVELANAEERGNGLERELQSNRSALLDTSAALESADALIRRARTEPATRWQRIGEALRLSSMEPSRRALDGWPLPAVRLPPSASDDREPPRKETHVTMNGPASSKTRNPYLRANSLAELLTWHDLDFVRCAYVTVLGRQPDPQGEEYYVDRLRRGYSKYGILWQLRTSEEGPTHDPGIAGFDKQLRRHRNARNRLYGWLVRIFAERETDSRLERRLRAIENLLADQPKTLAGIDVTTAVRESIAAELSAAGRSDRIGASASDDGATVPHKPSDYEAVRGRLSPAGQRIYDRVYKR